VDESLQAHELVEVDHFASRDLHHHARSALAGMNFGDRIAGG
jgi:hypothetical protein